MKKILLFSILLLSLNVSFAQTDYTFKNGSAVIICNHEQGIPEEDFNKVFPAWTNHAQQKFDEGIVEMVQYTHDLNKGVAILINASDKVEENIAVANQYVGESMTIAKEAGVELGSPCKVIAMGPIWLQR